MAARKTFLSIGCQKAKSGIGKSTIQVTADDLLGFLAFEGIDANAHIIPGGFDDLFLAELTVLRRGVTWSKDARDAAAARGNRHEQDGLTGSFRFGKAVLKNGIPDDSRRTEIGFAFAQLFGTGSPAGRSTFRAAGAGSTGRRAGPTLRGRGRRNEQYRGEQKRKLGFHDDRRVPDLK
jgi:hypothetical protein